MQEHPFIPYFHILGRGKSNSYPLTIDEAKTTILMILEGKALP